MVLNESDIDQIRSIRNQSVLSLVLKWMIGLLVILAVLLMIRHFYAEFNIWNYWIWSGVTFIMILSFALTMYPYLKDERLNIKLVENHTLIKKETEIRWTYTMNPIVDFQGHKPHLKLYKLITKNDTFFVEEDFFNNVSEGEVLELHKTPTSKLNLILKKTDLE